MYHHEASFNGFSIMDWTAFQLKTALAALWDRENTFRKSWTVGFIGRVRDIKALESWSVRSKHSSRMSDRKSESLVMERRRQKYAPC